jgi:type IV secretion system protein VirD4
MTSFHEEFRFGSARFATPDEVLHAGLLAQPGPFIGFAGGRPLRLAGDAPLITFGGAGSGKLRDVLAYNLCGFRTGNGWSVPRRMLVNDPRGELAAISIHNQIRFGKAAYCINPFGLHGLPQHRVNPWNIIDKNSRTFDIDVKLLVADLIPLPTGDEKYFSARAREWSEAMVKTIALGKPASQTWDAISLPDFYDLVNGTEDQSAWEQLAELMLNRPEGDIRRVAAEMDNKRANAPKEYGAIMGSLFESISFLSDPSVRECLSGSDFSLDVLCKEDCNVYLMIPAEYLSLLAPMQRAIFGATILNKNRNPSAPRVLLIVDEAAQLGNFEALLRAYSYGRGMGLRAWSIWQDPGQITRNFGPAALSGFIGSSQCRQFFGVRDLETARIVSNMLGQQTLEYDAVLEQDAARRNLARVVSEAMNGGDPFAAGLSTAQFSRAAKHRTKQMRALMTPDEVLNMPEEKQVLFVSGLGLHPILADKYPYFTRPEMAGAYLPNPFHPPTDRVRIATRSRLRWARVITERVPKRFARYPQYQSGQWSFIEGFRPGSFNFGEWL